MSMSIAESRQQLSALIAAAQLTPQVITKRNTPVAVVVSTEYFNRSKVAIQPVEETFYSALMALREKYPPSDNTGLNETLTRAQAWSRPNSLIEPS